jgi:four helix bundle protein
VAKRLPNFENFALANQIRRAGISLTTNIAEGHGRFYYLEQIKFMRQSRGSLQELIDDLNICEDELFADRRNHFAQRERLASSQVNRWLYSLLACAEGCVRS